MANQPRAVVVPFSSMVGSSVTIHAPEGRVVGQLAILNTSGPDDTRDEMKAKQIAIATEVALALNMHAEMLHMLEVVLDGERDEIKDGGQTHVPFHILDAIERLVKQGKSQ